MEEKNAHNKIDKLISRVDVLINLALKQQIDAKKTNVRKQIKFLNSLGFDYKEIAKIFGKSPTYIASELTFLKKKGGDKSE